MTNKFSKIANDKLTDRKIIQSENTDNIIYINTESKKSILD